MGAAWATYRLPAIKVFNLAKLQRGFSHLYVQREPGGRTER